VSIPNPRPETVLDLARSYAARGWRPFPVQHGAKTPVGNWGTMAATAQPDKMLALWFGGEDRNIGIACKPSGLIVLDEDVDGEIERLCADQGQRMPDTYRVRTAKGWHWYFTDDEGVLGNRARVGGYGIDVRGGGDGHGGYVLAAGSLHPSGVEYIAADERADVAPLPEWLRTWLTGTPDAERIERERVEGDRSPFTKADATKYVGGPVAALKAATEGGRNDALNSAAMAYGHFVPALCTREDVHAYLGRISRNVGLDEHEIAPTIDSGLDAGMSEPYPMADEPDDDDPIAEDAGDRVARLIADEVERMEIRELARREVLRRASANRPTIAEGVLDDLDAIEAPTMLLGSLIPELGVGFLGGRSGSYKSFLAVAWACCIGTGTAWLGRDEFAVRRPLKTLYVAAEGASGAAARMKAWEARTGISRRGKVLLYPRPIQLNDDLRAEELSAYVAEHGIEFLVIDTFRRSTSNGDDNSTTEMGVVFDAVARIRDDHACGALFIDHTGHAGERLRGASVKGDDADYVMIANYDGQSRGPEVPRTLTVVKLKDEESGSSWPIGLTHVPGHFPVIAIREDDDDLPSFAPPSWWEHAPSMRDEDVEKLVVSSDQKRGVATAQQIWRLLVALGEGDADTADGLTPAAILRMLKESPEKTPSESGVRGAVSLLVKAGYAIRDGAKLRLPTDRFYSV
jgi:hypothetical protein